MATADDMADGDLAAALDESGATKKLRKILSLDLVALDLVALDLVTEDWDTKAELVDGDFAAVLNASGTTTSKTT